MKIEGDVGARNIIKKNHKDFLKMSISDSGVIEDIDTEKQYLSYIKNEENN